MTQYVGCDQASGLLDALIDGELSINDQVVVESHLRWCRTCAVRVSDLRLIGSAMRLGSALDSHGGEVDADVSAISERVLMRVRAEQQESFGVRVREMFADMRFLWPALGATVAVVICVGIAFGVLNSAMKERPESLAAMIETLGNPGTERNPVRPNGVSIPRMLDDGAALEAIPEEDAVFAIRTVVSRDGRVTTYELLPPDRAGVRHEETAERAEQVEAVLDAVKQMRFAPAQTRGGQAVAVDMVWVIAKTTAVKGPLVDFDVPLTRARRPKDVPKPAVDTPAGPVNQRSSTSFLSTTA